MASSNPDATDRTKWKGQNLLGKVLTSVRDELAKSVPGTTGVQPAS
jgi:hypothetical protein